MNKNRFFKPIVWVEGNIGAGKSTFTGDFARFLGYRPFFELADQNPYLKLFYEDFKRWAFPMQIHLMQRRYAQHQLAAYESISHSEWNGCIIDRGLPGDRVFAEAHYDDNNIHELEWQTYQEFYELMTRTLTPPAVLIYLDASPEVCYERARGDSASRNRDSETPMEDDEFYKYLVKLETYYFRLIDDIQQGFHAWSSGITVHKLNWNINSLNPQRLAPIFSRLKVELDL
ncbi:hypothetical protein LCGC14_0303180 [marine sediment metagenome]|uniref:Deoxynucleoside kinase domain-containing protein n=1 Tax=marine sediment metagenome TaxID=412755 RepID=A0A0F9U6U9_9ZZZZ